MSQIPVTVLTGFLGAGKTTLLNRILTEKHGRKYAVIVNEFGELGIDGDLVVGADEEVFEMNNGCICCTVRGDLIRIIGGLMKRRGKFDAIVIETTGLADPAPVAQTFFVDDEVKGRAKLDSIVAVVDAKHLLQRLKDSREAEEQIAFADVIVLNKTDLVSPAELGEVEAVVRAINRFAPIHRARQCDVDLAKVLDRGSFDLDRILKLEPDFLDRTPEDHNHDHDHDHAHGHGHEHSHGHSHAHGHDDAHGDSHGHGDEDSHGDSHDDRDRPAKPAVLRHNPEVTSVSLRLDRPLSMPKFENWFRRMLAAKGQDLLRSKGILDFAGQDKRYVMHAVHMQVDGKPTTEWKPGEKRDSRIVFIGRKLDAEDLKRGFESCAA
jgi:G3E family GTPase